MNQSKKPRESFKKLQNKWYKKLKEEGFEDVEWYNEKTGYGQNSAFLKRSTGYLRHVFDPQTVQLYSLIRNFLVHTGSPAPLKSAKKFFKPKKIKHLHVFPASKSKKCHKDLPSSYSPTDNLHHLDTALLEYYLEGLTYRHLSKAMQARYPFVSLKFSIFWISKRINMLKQTAFTWNKINPEGLNSSEQLEQLEQERNNFALFMESNGDIETYE